MHFMDALTQLMESYVSTRSNPLTDAMVISGLRTARDGMLALYQDPANSQAQERMAYASLLSGICLAQTGLGSVHGLASPLGAFYPIPHGVVCGTLVAGATELNIKAMKEREPGNPALARYARLADILHAKRHKTADDGYQQLCQLLHHWTDELNLKRLSEFGLDENGLDHVVTHLGRQLDRRHRALCRTRRDDSATVRNDDRTTCSDCFFVAEANQLGVSGANDVPTHTIG